jgi:hypothetical protein
VYTKGCGGSADLTLGYHLYTAKAVYYAATRHPLHPHTGFCSYCSYLAIHVVAQFLRPHRVSPASSAGIYIQQHNKNLLLVLQVLCLMSQMVVVLKCFCIFVEKSVFYE